MVKLLRRKTANLESEVGILPEAPILGAKNEKVGRTTWRDQNSFGYYSAVSSSPPDVLSGI